MNSPIVAEKDTKNPKYKLLKQYSDIGKVAQNAKGLYKQFGNIFISTRPNKKFMIKNPKTGKWVHFGQMNFEDFTKHKDQERRIRYLKRAMNIKGNWRNDAFSPNILSINLLW